MGEYTPRLFDPDDPNWIDYERPFDAESPAGVWLIHPSVPPLVDDDDV